MICNENNYKMEKNPLDFTYDKLIKEFQTIELNKKLNNIRLYSINKF